MLRAFELPTSLGERRLVDYNGCAIALSSASSTGAAAYTVFDSDAVTGCFTFDAVTSTPCAERSPSIRAASRQARRR